MSATHETPPETPPETRPDTSPGTPDQLRPAAHAAAGLLVAAHSRLAAAEDLARATGSWSDDLAVLDACDQVLRARVTLALHAAVAGDATGPVSRQLVLDSLLPLLSTGGCGASPRT